MRMQDGEATQRTVHFLLLVRSLSLIIRLLSAVVEGDSRMSLGKLGLVRIATGMRLMIKTLTISWGISFLDSHTPCTEFGQSKEVKLAHTHTHTHLMLIPQSLAHSQGYPAFRPVYFIENLDPSPLGNIASVCP